MRRELIIAAGPGEWRAALLEVGAAVELYIERGDRKRAGSIHAGRVIRVAKGLDSAFVEIGDSRPGLAPRREGPGLDEGARILVEIRREALPDKGARLTTRLTRAVTDHADLDPPAQLYPAPGSAASLALALSAAPDRIHTDDPAIVPELRAAFPEAEIERGVPLDLDAEFAAALASSLALPGGGTVHIAETRAATMIDVDTGTPETGSAARNALAGNIEAAHVIARHIRLRNLGGGIVVDFVGIEGKGPREQVRQALVDAIATDPARPQCLGWTRLGHIEIVRPYRSPSLAAQLGDPALTHALAALRVIARAQPAARWRLTVSQPVAAALRGPAAAALTALEARLGDAIAIAEDPAANPFTIASR